MADFTIEDLSISRDWIGLRMFVETFRRASNHSDKALREMATLDGGYCLDAPELIPAGGCRNWDVPGDPERLCLPEQITVERGECPSDGSSETR